MGNNNKNEKRKLNIKDSVFVKRAKNSIFPILMFGFMIGFFGPVQLYLNNASEFYFYFKDIAGICIGMTLVVITVLLLIVMLTPTKVSDWIGTVLFGIALAFYIQGNYVNVDYGTLNGDALVWSRYKAVAVWDTLLWIVCIAIPIVIKLVKPKLVKPVKNYVSVWIIAIQVVTLVVLALGLKPKTQNNGECIFTNEGIYTLSSKENVILLVLDCYETTDFSKLIEEHSEYKELFSNFTYYPNTVGGSTRTVLALPHLLTGKPYVSEGTYADYLNDSFDSSAVFKELKAQDYDTRVYTEPTFAPSEADVEIDNMSTGSKKVTNYTILGQKLYQFTACQYMPHVLKQFVWMYSGDFDKAARNNKSEASAYQLDDDIFYEQMCKNKISTIEDKAFRVYHLNGAHGPFKLHKDATINGKETSLEEQQIGVMLIIEEFFNQMKELGIYDDSTIIILGDHGAYGIECNPIFMVKDKMNTKNFTVSKVPVSYDNLEPTVLKALGKKSSSDNKPVDELTMDDNKERYFYYQDKKSNDSVQYKITGELPNNATIEKTGKTFKLFAAEAKEYELGEELHFDIGGTAMAYVSKGLGKTEAGQTWTSGEEFVMTIPFDYSDNDDLYLHFKLNKTWKDAPQHVKATINGTFVNWYLVEDRSLNIKIPNELVKDKGEIKIELGLPDATFDGDERYVSLLMNYLVIDKINGNFAETKIVDGKEAK